MKIYSLVLGLGLLLGCNQSGGGATTGRQAGDNDKDGGDSGAPGDMQLPPFSDLGRRDLVLSRSTDFSAPLDMPALPDCGLFLDCNCVDGTSAELGCGEDCDTYCSGHGGAEPFGVCPPGETACGGLCTRPAIFLSDPDNCGGCNNYCSEYTICVEGVCTVDLPDGGGFVCEKDTDCGDNQACVLNLATNCRPFCATICQTGNGGESCPGNSTCSDAVDVATNVRLTTCIDATLCH